MNNRIQQYISLALGIGAAYLLFAVLYGWLGGTLSVFAPGIFLFKSFHAAALFLPLFLALQSRLVLAEPFPKRTFFKINLFVIPFLTFALFLKVLFSGDSSPAEQYFITAFGPTLSIVLLLALTAVSILLILKLGEYLFPEDNQALFSVQDWMQALLPKTDRSQEDTVQDEPQQDWNPDPSPFSKKQDYEPMLDQAQRAQHVVEDQAVEEETVKIPVDSAIAEIIKGKPLSPASPPAPKAPEAPAAIDPLGSNDAELHDLIAKVLKGDQAAPEQPQEESLDEEFAPLNTREKEELSKAQLQQAVEEEPLQEPEPVAVEPNIEPVWEEPQPEPTSQEQVQEEVQLGSREEEKLNSLLSTLDHVLEEERPMSISDKLSPEDPMSVDNDPVEAPAPKRSRPSRRIPYEVPVEGILTQYPDSSYAQIDDDTRRAAEVLEQTLMEFKIDAQVTGISRGPVITMFELLPAPGVKLSRIVALQDNIALRLAASRVRIVAPIPGKHAVGIEIPNKKRSLVGFSQLVTSKDMKRQSCELPIVLGKDISGGDQVIDLARTPHLLIAGSTGSGKSVCVNTLICSLLYERSHKDVKMILVDPKIVELKLYNDIPHLLTPVITEPKKAFQAVQWALYEMERRYSLLDAMGVRDIKTYNKRIKEREMAKEKLPYLVLVIDEFADLMATSGKELEGIVARLAAMSRAVGIHLVLATQRPSTDVITGLIKANFPSRIAFMVASMTDSRIIIDSAGAEKLLGRGDMLFTSSWDPFPTRVQGSFLSEEEVERVVNHVKTLGEPDYIDDEIFTEEEEDCDNFSLNGDYGEDPLFDKALEVVVNTGKASASYLQRRLKIGYNRAARLVEDMEERGIVGPANGSKPRDLLHVPERVKPAEEPSMAG